MYVATSANEKYRPLAEGFTLSAKCQGYYPYVWDLGNLGELQHGHTIKYDPQPQSWAELRRWKPRYIREFRQQMVGEIAYLDCDSLIVRRFDDIFNKDFDIGFVVKRKKGDTDRIRVKAGMVFMRDNAKVTKLLDEWISRIKGGHRDQYALWEYVSEFHPLDINIYGKIIDVGGTKVYMIPHEKGLLVEMRRAGDVKNAPAWSKILHLSGMGKNKFAQKVAFLDEFDPEDHS